MATHVKAAQTVVPARVRRGAGVVPGQRPDNSDLLKALAASHRAAKRAGTDRLTMEEIIAEIKAYRIEKRAKAAKPVR
jgi:hypothetical protein